MVAGNGRVELGVVRNEIRERNEARFAGSILTTMQERYAVGTAAAAMAHAFFADRDIASVDVAIVRANQASSLFCRVELRGATHPEKSVEHVLDQLFRGLGPLDERPTTAPRVDRNVAQRRTIAAIPIFETRTKT